MRSYIFTDTDFEENNPSVSCADSSLYTREPWFSVNRKCKCHTVNKRRFNSGFHILMKLSEILSMGESHFVDEVYWADILIFIRQRRSRQSLIRLPKRDSHSVGSVIRTVGTDKRLLVFVRKRYLYRIRPAPLREVARVAWRKEFATFWNQILLFRTHALSQLPAATAP